MNRALLIGVSKYKYDVGDLPVVKRDIDALARVLELQHYEIKIVDETDEPSLYKTSIEDAIFDFCTAARAADTLLIYFSGHGFNIDGKDFLMPADAHPGRPDFTTRLISPSIDLAVSASQASNIIFFVDACREQATTVYKGVKAAIGTESGVCKYSTRTFVLVFSCERDQLSRFSDADDGISHFTQAIIDAIAPSTDPRTLGEVLEYAQRRLHELTQAHKHAPQRIFSRVEQAVQGIDPLSAEVCQSPRTASIRARMQSPWCLAAEASPIWDGEQSSAPPELPNIRENVLSLVANCWEYCSDVQNMQPNDPWNSSDLACRVLKNLHHLITYSGINLTLPERALLVGIPFLSDASSR